MHKGIKPPAQPRSVRSVAQGNESKNFPAGLPVEEGWRESSDSADAIKPKTAEIRGVTPADKTPFQNIRGGK